VAPHRLTALAVTLVLGLIASSCSGASSSLATAADPSSQAAGRALLRFSRAYLHGDYPTACREVVSRPGYQSHFIFAGAVPDPAASQRADARVPSELASAARKGCGSLLRENHRLLARLLAREVVRAPLTLAGVFRTATHATACAFAEKYPTIVHLHSGRDLNVPDGWPLTLAHGRWKLLAINSSLCFQGAVPALR